MGVVFQARVAMVELGEIANGLEVTLERLLLVAKSVYPDPTLSMLRPVKGADPETAFFTEVPERVPEAGFVSMVKVMAALEEGTIFPAVS